MRNLKEAFTQSCWITGEFFDPLLLLTESVWCQEAPGFETCSLESLFLRPSPSRSHWGGTAWAGDWSLLWACHTDSVITWCLDCDKLWQSGCLYCKNLQPVPQTRLRTPWKGEGDLLWGQSSHQTPGFLPRGSVTKGTIALSFRFIFPLPANSYKSLKTLFKGHTSFAGDTLQVSGRGRSFVSPSPGSPGWISAALAPERTALSQTFFSVFIHNVK